MLVGVKALDVPGVIASAEEAVDVLRSLKENIDDWRFHEFDTQRDKIIAAMTSYSTHIQTIKDYYAALQKYVHRTGQIQRQVAGQNKRRRMGTTGLRAAVF